MNVIGNITGFVNQSNILATGVPAGEGIFVGKGTGDWRQEVFDSEEAFWVSGAVAQRGSYAGGNFPFTDGTFVVSDRGSFAVGDFNSARGSYAAADFGSIVGGNFNTASNSFLYGESGSFVGGLLTLSSNVGLSVINGIGSASLNNRTNVSITANRSMVLANAPNDYTNTINDTVGIINRSGVLVGFNTNVLYLSGKTNEIADNGTSLTYNNTPIGGTTNFFTVGKGGHLTITNSITILTNGALALSNLPAPSVLVLGTNQNVTNATLSGLTLSDGNVLTAGGGDTTATNIVTLTQTGTNAAQLDFSLVARGGVFKLSLTNNAYFGAPASVNNTDFKKAWLAVRQPSTGTCLVTFTNGFFAQPGGNNLINDTNAGAIVWYEMLSNPFSNGIVDLWMSQKSQLVP